jgi:hypothetical protein
MDVERVAKDTLTALELDVGDRLRFTLSDGATRTIVVRAAHAEVESRGKVWNGEDNGVLRYRIACVLEIDGHRVELVRTIPSQQNFVPPYTLFGMRLWLDTAGDLSQFLGDTHGGVDEVSACFPRRALRIAIWDERNRICPVLLHPWCPLPVGGLKPEYCYRGEDTWMGPFCGREAHNGLDINHPAGTPLWTPISIDEHEMFNSIERGDNNNRWRGVHHWPNGADWILQSHHLIRLTVPQDRPIAAGTAYAESAGAYIEAVEHSHFVFRVVDDGAEVLLDPWLLFWQMYEDRVLTSSTAPG